MSGYFVHGGTQFPFTQNATQQAAPASQTFFGSTSFATTQAIGQSTQYSSYSSSGTNFASPSTQPRYRAVTSSTSSAFGGSSSPYTSSSTGFSSGAFNSAGSSATFGTIPTTQSSYEKALYNAANIYYSNKTLRGTSTGGRGSFGGRGRGGRGGGRGGSTQAQSTGPKPIRASEIKAYLYAWCGQRKLKPEYEITTEGKPPQKVTFSCRLRITGLDHVAEVEATNKKDSQTKAAWAYCDNLVKLGYMKVSELPPRPVDTTSTSATDSTKTAGCLPGETTETVEAKGGWSLANARQRLNQFCQREQITPIFKHTTLGPEHSRVFLCELSLTTQTKKEYNASQRGNNKKQATSMCALEMVRQLYGDKLIERFGDPVKHVTYGGLMVGKGNKSSDSSATDEPTLTPAFPVPITGQKRKADDQTPPENVDENGNWTVDNSRQRLNQFCLDNNLPCVVLYEEEGAQGNRTFTASLSLKVKRSGSDQMAEVSSVAKGQSKRVAAQGCALQLLAQLYKLSLVEAGPNPDLQPSRKKLTRQKLDSAPGLEIPNYADYSFVPFGSDNLNMGGFTGFGRPPMAKKTPLQDAYLNEKHKTIYPTEHELTCVQKSVRTIEQALKDVSDELIDPDDNPVINKDGLVVDDADSTGKRRKLQGVMRVGALAKGLLLKGDMRVRLVLLCQEAPTAKLLVKVAQLLPRFIKTDEGNSFVVETAMQEAAINVTCEMLATETDPAVSCVVTISLTSPVMRVLAEDAAKDAPGALNKERCLQALAELRHSKWFQACANGLPSCVVIIRILRDMTRRLNEWKPLPDWAIELLVEKALSSLMIPISLGGAFLRCMEIIGSGILLPDGPGVSDPCEKTDCDVTASMTNQERETLTSSAQTFARLIIYRKINEVLGMEPIDWSKANRKSTEDRPMES